jgi:hypothetical protein
MGFPMGEEESFSERWILGRRLYPTPRGRRGCMFMLLAGFVVIVTAVILTSVVGR